MTVKLCHLWSDTLNWNGSRGNLTCLKKRLEWRGIPVEIQEVAVGETTQLDDVDLVYLGAGKAFENHALIRDISSKASQIQNYVSNGGTVLAVCEGFELLGKIISLSDGSSCPGLGLIEMKTIYGRDRLTGNAVMDTKDGKIVFFENHAGKVYPDAEIPFLGRMVTGHGNNAMDGFAGIHKDTIFGCQAHGPLLPKNPALADEILRTALSRRFPELQLTPLDDTIETNAHDQMIAKLL